MTKSKIISIHSDEGRRLIGKIMKASVVVLAGSAISKWAPTCLPPGDTFTNSLLEVVFPNSFLKSLNDRTRKYLKDAEFVFEVLLYYFPNPEILDSIMRTVFKTELFNPVHQALINGLTSNSFTVLITPNYDLCLDKLLGFTDYTQRSSSGTVRIVNEVNPEEVDVKSTRVYFKIHGSADNPTVPLTLSLAQESRLPRWKRETLKKSVTGRTLLVIGYSGSDFEICPELMEMDIKEVFWNWPDGREPSQNADRLIQEKGGCFLTGDMCDLLSELMGYAVQATDGDYTSAVSTAKSQLARYECENRAWRASLLINYGFIELGQQASQGLKDTPSAKKTLAPDTADMILAGSLFHLGKYKQAAIRREQQADSAKARGDTRLQAELLLYACDAWRNYGEVTRSYQCLNSARALANQLAQGEPEREKRLFALVYLRDTHQLSFYANPLEKILKRIFKVDILAESIRTLAEQKFQKIVEFAADAGDWSTYFNVPQWANDLGVDSNKLTVPMGYPPLPDPTEGYRRVGYFVGESIVLRDRLNKGLESLTDNRTRIKGFVNKCYDTGNYPEVWKLLRVKAKCQGRIGILQLIFSWKFQRSFWTCQYSNRNLMRIFQFLFST